MRFQSSGRPRADSKCNVEGLCIALLIVAILPASAAQIDIAGPSGSRSFGWKVAVLPNGNIVVADPEFTLPSAYHAGAVFLYSPDLTLLSTLTGSNENDSVGEGLTVLTNGNFVVSSPEWNNAGAIQAGAVTWVDGNAGLNGTVSESNSLVGLAAVDGVGGYAVTALANGNYVIAQFRME